MDSLTQAALGSAVAHACWHRALGRRALGWGLVLGTLPDLDVVAFPLMDSVERLYWHRGPSHGVLFIAAASIVLGLLLARLHRGRDLSRVRATVGVGLVLVTHVAIDLFTVYGTQILAPFSRHGFGTNNLFIIDPLYTLPLLLGLLMALVLRNPARRIQANRVGLVLSTLYVVWSFIAQAQARQVFEHALVNQGVTVIRAQTSASPLNTLLWRHLAEVEGGFLVGYWSLWDDDRHVSFDFVPRNEQEVAPHADSRAFQVVDWFSQGFWSARSTSAGIELTDLRFNEFRPSPGAPPESWAHVFTWRVGDGVADAAGLEPVPAEGAARAGLLPRLWRRIRGDRSAW